jgi:hypothetical protein
MIFVICVSVLSVPSVQGQKVYTEGIRREAAAAVAGLDAGEVLPASAHAASTSLVSHRKPDGLILSEGNLYFTSHDGAGAAVWRTAQGSVPGQEGVLYWEQGAEFGDIAFSKVDGVFFGYFFATKNDVTTIRRVPLAGGTAAVLATVTKVDVVGSHRNLIADGVHLFWQDDRAVRRMPIRGGAVTILDRTSLNPHTAGLAQSGGDIIYASGADIRFVPKNGSAVTGPSVRTIVTATSRVTSLLPVSNGVYWGEESGAVRLKVGSTIRTIRLSAGLVPTSMATNGFTAGGPLAWTHCDSQTCRLQLDFSAFSPSSAISAGALGVTITSSGNVFWGDARGVHRQTF